MNWMEKCFHVIILKLVSIGERNEHVCSAKAMLTCMWEASVLSCSKLGQHYLLDKISIQWIIQFPSQIRTHWIVFFPVDTIIQHLNNWCLRLILLKYLVVYGGSEVIVLFCFQALLLNCHNLFVNLFGIPACHWQKENHSQNFDWL